jgi:hypothetical protein
MAYQQSSKNAARELFQTILSEEQLNRFNKAGTVEIAAKGGIYRISTHGPTQVLDSETRRVVATMHFQPAATASVRDRVIAEYLLIRNDEDLYWQTATLSPETSSSLRPLLFLMAVFDAILLIVLLAQLH